MPSGAAAGLVLATLTLALPAAAAAMTGGDVLADPFDDGVIDPGWQIIGSDPDVIVPAEQNGRLEFPSAGGGGAFAGLLSRWTLSSEDDFRVRIDYGGMAPLAGEVGLSFAIVFAGDIETGTIVDGFVLDVGYEPEGPFACVTQFLGGQEFSTCDVVVGEDPTMYLWYDADADRLWGSYLGFDDPTANSGIQLRESSGADRVQVALVGFVDADAPPVPGSDLFFDDFRVVSGTLLAPASPADVNGDGVVDLVDLLLVLSDWGPCPGCSADIDGSGFVDFGDLLALLGAWSD